MDGSFWEWRFDRWSITLPAASTTHTAVSFTDTSRPTK
jgi:hypothetical protein